MDQTRIGLNESDASYSFFFYISFSKLLLSEPFFVAIMSSVCFGPNIIEKQTVLLISVLDFLLDITLVDLGLLESIF